MTRYTVLLFVFLFSALSTFSQDCDLVGDMVPDVTGKLIGYDPELHADLNVKFTTLIPIGVAQHDIFADIQNDGSFSIDLVYPLRYRQAWFRVEGFFYSQVIMDKGLDIEIDLTCLSKKRKRGYMSSECVKWKGQDAELNYLINDWTLYQQKKIGRNGTTSVSSANRGTALDEYERLLTDARNLEVQVLDDFLSKQETSYGWFLKNKLESDVLGLFAVMYWNAEMPDHIEKEILAHSPCSVSNESMISFYGYWSSGIALEKWKDLPKRISSLSNVIVESDSLKFQMALHYAKEKGSDLDLTKERKMLSEISLSYQKELNNYDVDLFLENIKGLSSYQQDMLILNYHNYELWEKKAFFDKVKERINDPVLKRIFVDSYTADLKQLEVINRELANMDIKTSDSSLGEQVGNIDTRGMYLANQDSLLEMLGAIKAAYPDKHIILDVWAVWCGPCIDDMRKSTANLRKLDDRDVEVIYLCSSNGAKEKTWKQRVLELNVPKDHLFLSPKLSKDIMSFFDLSGYPSHIFIDNNGKVHKDMVHHISLIDFDRLDFKLAKVAKDSKK